MRKAAAVSMPEPTGGEVEETTPPLPNMGGPLGVSVSSVEAPKF